METEKKNEVKKAPYTIEVVGQNEYGFALMANGQCLMPVTDAELHLLQELRQGKLNPEPFAAASSFLQSLDSGTLSQDWANMAELATIILSEKTMGDLFELRHGQSLYNLRELTRYLAPVA